MVSWLVTQYRLLLVFILPSVIPDVVQRLEPPAGVRVVLLHDLVGNPADLTAEGADQVVSEGQQVDILDDATQGAVRVSADIWILVTKYFTRTFPPGADGGSPGHLLVSEKLDVRIFLPTLAQHSGLV